MSVRKVIDAAGGPVKLAKALGITYTAVNTFERQGYFPLARAKQVMTLYPQAVELREIVRPDIRAAMDLGQSGSLLA